MCEGSDVSAAVAVETAIRPPATQRGSLRFMNRIVEMLPIRVV